MLSNIFSNQSISSRFQNFRNLLFQKTINQQSNNNLMKKIPQVIESSIHQGVKKVETIIGDTGELIRTPAKWLKDMQSTWLISIICLAIICLCVLFFYCVCQGYFSCRRSNNSRLTNRLAEITMNMAKNTNTNVNKY